MITLVKAIAGSKLYGTNTHESDDDFMGIFVSSPEQKLGLSPVEHIGGDDDVMYELGKYVRLAVSGNPTVLQLLWTPEQYWVQWDSRWPQIQKELRQLCVSEKCRPAFIGYMDQQMKKMISDRQQRPHLVEKYGFDTKFAAHALRLGAMGYQLLSVGELQFPLPNAQWLVDVRNGLLTKDQCMSLMMLWLNDLKTCKSVLPPDVDRAKINTWLAQTYKEWWG